MLYIDIMGRYAEWVTKGLVGGRGWGFADMWDSVGLCWIRLCKRSCI